MFNCIDNLAIIIISTPIMILVVYAAGALSHSFFGGTYLVMDNRIADSQRP